MAGLNKAMILGRVGRIDLKVLDNGMKIASFSMATSYKRKDGQEKTEWHNCVAFDVKAELIEKYVRVGDMLYADGMMEQVSYKSQQGDLVKTTRIVVQTINFCGSQGQRQEPQPQQTKEVNKYKDTVAKSSNVTKKVTIEDINNVEFTDDIPF